MSTRIQIEAIELDMETIPGIDPGLFARHLELELGRLDLPGVNADRYMSSLALPQITARAGETAVTLAKRVGAEIGRQLAAAAGGRP